MANNSFASGSPKGKRTDNDAGTTGRSVMEDQHVGGTRPVNQPSAGSLGGAKGARPNSPKG